MENNLEKLGKSKRAFFEFIVSKDLITEESFEELKKVSTKAFQYGKANSNARYREHVLLTTGKMCCEYCGKDDLIHNPLRTSGDENDFMTSMSEFFYGGKKVAIPATVDHINPISLGGNMVDYNNLAISCEECNSHKGSFTFNEWEDYMKNKKKYEFFFLNNQHKSKYDKAREFIPDTEKYYEYNDVVVMDRTDLSAYMRYVLGKDYGNSWQIILKADLLKCNYEGGEEPNLKKRQWIGNDGKLFDIDSVKLKIIKKYLAILENEKYYKLFLEIHKLKLSNTQLDKWKSIFKKIIKLKDTSKG